MTTTAIQTAVLDNNLKQVLESLVTGGTSVDATARTAAAAAQTDIDAIEASVIADMTALRNAILAITAKIDAETVIGQGTNYAATCNPAALTTA